MVWIQPGDMIEFDTPGLVQPPLQKQKVPFWIHP